MKHRDNNPHKKQYKDNKIELLKSYIETRSYIDITEQPEVCKSFELPFIKSVFREIYRQRFFKCLQDAPKTVAEVEKITGIPQKYLTICKLYYQKRGLLRVVALGVCPITKSRNVQFVTTCKSLVGGTERVLINNQTTLFN